MSEYIVKGGRQLRFGYTTGSCATAAATAAAVMLFSQKPLEQILIALPQGEQVVFNLEQVSFTPHRAECAVMKDAGDDPDVTDGIRIVAVCEKREEKSCYTFGNGLGGTLGDGPSDILDNALSDGFGDVTGNKFDANNGEITGENVAGQASDRVGATIAIEGGEGIGIVTMDGLPVPKGKTAINPVPHKMINSNVAAVCRKFGYTGGLRITLSAPEGEERARKTFNPRLGIMGGISILGTTGIVEPMSEKAMVDTVKLLLDKQKLLDSETVVIAPGNYGRSFVTEKLGINSGRVVAYANFLGECLDYIGYKKFQRILLVGHFGKLVKVAGGIMQTHSSVADCRMEIITAHAACAGADRTVAEKLMQCPTTDAAIALLEQEGLNKAVFASLLNKIMYHLGERLKRGVHEALPSGGHGEAHNCPPTGKCQQPPVIEVVIFSGDSVLLQSKGAGKLITRCRKEKL